MPSVGLVIFFSLIGGFFSLIGGFLLIAGKKNTHKVVLYATPFAAGALLAAAFIGLLPEAVEGNAHLALMGTLSGILIFFLLERFFRWFHHHHSEEDKHKDPRISLIVIGDTVHNFIDGIAIAAAFLVDTQTGIAVTLAVAAHEIPQEFGDFSLLLSKGMSKTKVVLVNIFSALATTVAAVLFFVYGNANTVRLDIVLGLVAGFFIYIAVSDILPSIHQHEAKILAGPQTAMLILGTLVVGGTITLVHNILG